MLLQHSLDSSRVVSKTKEEVFVLEVVRLKSKTCRDELKSFGEHVFFSSSSISLLNIFLLFTLPRLDCLSEPFQVHQHLNCNSKEAPLCEPETLCRRLCSGSEMTQKQTCVRVRVLPGVRGLRACGRVQACVSKCVCVALQGGKLMQSDKNNLQFLFRKEREKE